MSGYGLTIREAFAKTYAHTGNATHALRIVLGAERANKMKPHTLRAKASTLLNDYRTVALIEAEKERMQQAGERLPRYRLRTWRADLMAEMPEPNRQKRERKENQKRLWRELMVLQRKLTVKAMQRLRYL